MLQHASDMPAWMTWSKINVMACIWKYFGFCPDANYEPKDITQSKIRKQSKKCVTVKDPFNPLKPAIEMVRQCLYWYMM